MSDRWISEKENLEKLIKEGVSYEKIGKHYNCSGTNIKKVAKKLGISLPLRRRINPCETFNKDKGKTLICLNCGKEFKPWEDGKEKHLFCCFKCSSEYRHKTAYNDFLKGGEYYMRASWNPQPFKNDILNEQNNVCEICGCKPEHNGKPLVFVLDHIDGDASNNRRENLRMICPNCDSQLDTYKSKNKNSARKYIRHKIKEELKKLKEELKKFQNN